MMIRHFKFLLVLVCLVGLCTFMACSPDEQPQPGIEEQQLQKLAKVWVANTVTLNGVAQTGYENFRLSLNGATTSPFPYQTNNRPSTSPWPASGTWKFGNDPLSKLARDPASTQQLDMIYTVSSTELQLSFTFSGTGFSGRSKSVDGQWVFKFTAQ
ncbi:MAG: hypothetical protein KF763_19000 [Cyclobacteriaceae bacterium]|nr:hypothetical protein [Cyclobacteriaceae bacterium]